MHLQQARRVSMRQGLLHRADHRARLGACGAAGADIDNGLAMLRVVCSTMQHPAGGAHLSGRSIVLHRDRIKQLLSTNMLYSITNAGML
jgi:hypothetical protein